MEKSDGRLQNYRIKKFVYLKTVLRHWWHFYKFIRINILDFFIENRLPQTKIDVVFIRQGGIGDFIIWLDQAKKLKEIYKDRKSLLVCNSLVSEIARKTNYFGEIFEINDILFVKDLKYRKEIIKKLREIECEDLVSSTYTRSIFGTDFVVKNIKAKNKIGYNSDDIIISKILRKYCDRIYTLLIKSEKKEMMELIRNAEFIRKVYNIEFRSSLPNIAFELPDVEIESKKDRIVFFLASSDIIKSWACKNFVELAKIIPLKYDIILCGTKKEKEYSESFEKMYNGKSKVYNMCGKTNLLETLSIIKNSKLVIGNDSSCIHMSVALRRKSLGVLSGWHFGRFLPYNVEILSAEEKKILPQIVCKKMECFNCNRVCKYKLEKNSSYKCIEEIDVEEAKVMLKKIIKEIDRL